MASDQPFQPSLGDVLVVRSMLAQAVILPELVGTILDYAEYWVRSCSKAQLDESIHAIWSSDGYYQGSKFLLRSFPVGLTENAIHREEDEDEYISNGRSYETATIPPIPIGKACDREYFQSLIRNPPTQPHPVRKIVFRIVSHDQGWTSDDQSPGPFIVARTWFDAGIERFDASHSCKFHNHSEECEDMRKLPLCKLRTIEPEIVTVTSDDGQSDNQYAKTPYQGPREIQRNKMADGNFQTYVTTWTCWDVYAPDSEEARRKMEEGKGRMNGDGSFVRSLGLGDVVTVWGRALYAGWVNVVESVEIEIYWAL
ncbi:hypothetical protein M419DRAFT_73431 [Trichoderma reesei RUT C-30]|uniref:Uncharacterized protein n=1 Tax=Hypocrea jecorina (strain ATCC 56765 / BCRC 32924 / NRRL 11460 / Rut C-30) TaxID=1344414 RepID=A0A024SGR9_HYPJR|nr:hypothetical protein M419DRAFT_73431 [Trichoderma reesei RUT C-30]